MALGVTRFGFFALLVTVVVEIAQGLKRAIPELVRIATVRLDVVANARGGHDAVGEAHAAQGFARQLLVSDGAPTREPIPRAPRRGVATTALIVRVAWRARTSASRESAAPTGEAWGLGHGL